MEGRPCEKPANKSGWDSQTHRNSGTIYSDELLAIDRFCCVKIFP